MTTANFGKDHIRLINERIFRIEFEDFIHAFDVIEICHLGPDTMKEVHTSGMAKSTQSNWSVGIFHGTFRGDSGNGL